jgi:glycosyltransferase involved in cell wall biosynthesis
LKPNVLQLVGSFHQGGSESQALQLTRLLLESGGHNVHLACMSPEGPLLEQVNQLDLEDVLAYPLTSFYAPSTAVQLGRFARFLRSRTIDVVHTHDFYTNVFGMAGATLAGTRARVAGKRETGGMRTKAQRRIELCAYKLSHAIVANSEAVGQQLIRDGVSAKKIVTIYNGLELERVKPDIKLPREAILSALTLPNSQPRRFVTIVANLRHTVKDHATFLRAASRVRSSIPEAAFVIAGEGELLEPMRTLAAELGLSHDAFFIGRCDRISELLGISEVCVLSSVAEGFSNAILEYMAASRPVVATDVGGAREAIREGITGFLVAAQDHASMAERIIQLLHDPHRARAMGERGRRVVVEQFSSRAQLEQTELLYERLLTRGKTEIVPDGKMLPTEKS